MVGQGSHTSYLERPTTENKGKASVPTACARALVRCKKPETDIARRKCAGNNSCAQTAQVGYLILRITNNPGPVEGASRLSWAACLLRQQENWGKAGKEQGPPLAASRCNFVAAFLLGCCSRAGFIIRRKPTGTLPA